jgi:myo-inositol 2-dehydrogenase/D-chiro-inositol 1-dehydrogenase
MSGSGPQTMARRDVERVGRAKWKVPVLRVGILSFAHYHANFWAETFSDDPRTSLVGLWDDDADRRLIASKRFGIPSFEAVEELLEKVEAVAVCSETARHRALIEKAAARGHAILCEKPIATTLRDADAIGEIVARSNVPFMQSFPKRLDPANLRLKSIVESGRLGQIRLARVRHGHDHGRDPAFTNGWWADPSESGGGTLIDEGVHAFDFLRWLFGDPVAIQASLSSSLPSKVEDTAAAILRWQGGLLAEVATSWAFGAAENSVEIYGTEGTALLSGVDLASRNLSGSAYLKIASAGAFEWEPLDVTPSFVSGRFHHAVATTFIDCLAQAIEPPSSVIDGRAALAIVLAAYESARTGKEISL